MKKALFYRNSYISSPVVIDISTEEKEKEGYLLLFRLLDERWGGYEDTISEEALEETEGEIEKNKERLKRLEEDSDIEKLFDVSQHSPARVEKRIERLREQLSEDRKHHKLYMKAKDGDWEAARKLLEERKNQEPDEYWHIHKFSDPKEDEVSDILKNINEIK